MSMKLQMLQKPPVIFTQYEPERAISAEDKAFAKRHSNALPWLWLSYSRFVLEDNDPCMEPNNGIGLTIAYSLQYKELASLKVKRMDAHSYELKLGTASLFLTETEEGDVFLYFFTPEHYCNLREDRRLDLTGYSSDASAYFIATIFAAYDNVKQYSQSE